VTASPPAVLGWVCCPRCGKRLLKGALAPGTVLEPYCKGCREPVRIAA
jgi:hypothetical protein